MNEIKFKIRKPSDLPSISKSYQNLQISDRYFGLAKNIHGDKVNTLTCYDFKNNKWIFISSGCVELIEYYI